MAYENNDIKLLVLDVDGTLTDGMIYYGGNDMEIKAFNIKDGAILKPLYRVGIEVIFLTGRKSDVVEQRALELNATAVQGVDDKLKELSKLLGERNLNFNQCAYIGDDLNDYAAMKRCGFKACPSDAVEEIKEICEYVSTYKGGHGAVRDICINMLHSEAKYGELLSLYNVNKV